MKLGRVQKSVLYLWIPYIQRGMGSSSGRKAELCVCGEITTQCSDHYVVAVKRRRVVIGHLPQMTIFLHPWA